MNSDHHPQVVENLTCTAVGEELLVLDESMGQIHQLNSSAALVFEACNGSTPVGDIVKRLQHQFDIDTEVAWRDVSSVLEALRARQLLRSL